MFDTLRQRMHGAFDTLRSRGVLTDAVIADANAALRQALLEADVHHEVIKTFLARVADEAAGAERQSTISPAAQYQRVVHAALVDILGAKAHPPHLGGGAPAVILCVGLQGSGKTTTVAKLGHWLKGQGKRPLLVPADLSRPAAVEQLQSLAREWELTAAEVEGRGGDKGDGSFCPPFTADHLSSHASLDTRGDKKNRPLCPLSVVERALDRARRELFDTVIIDTAGRLQIDTDLMAELGTIAKATKPVATILIIDAMAGQEGLGVAQGFHARTPLTGVIVTKADGDARGGVMLSCRTVLDLPIHFLGMGERPDALEPFHPDRVASRILDLGDLASLAEQVAAATDDETQVERVKRLAQGRLTLEDFRSQLKEMGKLGSMEGLLKMLPGAGRLMPKIDMGRISSDLQRKEAIIDSMTLQERAQFRLLNGSRRQRIARGSGTTVTDVNRLIKEFEMMQKMIKRGGKGRKRGAGLPPELMQLMGK